MTCLSVALKERMLPSPILTLLQRNCTFSSILVFSNSMSVWCSPRECEGSRRGSGQPAKEAPTLEHPRHPPLGTLGTLGTL